MGFQWFPIPWIDGSSEEEAERGTLAAAEDLNAFLDALMVDEDVFARAGLCCSASAKAQ